MPVRFDCPTCKTSYDVDDELAGKTIMCRGCQKRGQVRAAGASSRPAVPAPTATTAATSTATATAIASATSLAKPGLAQLPPTRREAMASLWVYGILAVGSIATGAILARTKVLRNLSFSEEEPDPRRRKGPRPDGTPPGGSPPKGNKGP